VADRDDMSETEMTPEEMFLWAIFGKPCDGSSKCGAGVHTHGCFADLDGVGCDHPEDHVAPAPAGDSGGERG
jgi:hypothetical protein